MRRGRGGGEKGRKRKGVGAKEKKEEEEEEEEEQMEEEEAGVKFGEVGNNADESGTEARETIGAIIMKNLDTFHRERKNETGDFNF